jgi:hypothetical protein
MPPPDRPLKQRHRLPDQHGLHFRVRKVGASVCHPNPRQKLLPMQQTGQTRLARYLPRGRALGGLARLRVVVSVPWRRCLLLAAAAGAVVAFVAKALSWGVPQAGAPALVVAGAKVAQRAQLVRVGVTFALPRWEVAGPQAAGWGEQAKIPAVGARDLGLAYPPPLARFQGLCFHL